MLFGRDLQHGGDGLHVRVDGVADHLSDELVDQNDADVAASQEAPGGSNRKLACKRTKKTGSRDRDESQPGC